jgi:hypothetical protein
LGPQSAPRGSFLAPKVPSARGRTKHLLLEEELDAALSRPRYGRRKATGNEDAAALVVGCRHGHRKRTLTGTFGKTDISVPRALIKNEDSPVHGAEIAAADAGYASIVASKGLPANSVYSATKAAVRSFARTWTTDLKERRIRVNAVSPGSIDTPGLSDSLDSSEAGGDL